MAIIIEQESSQKKGNAVSVFVYLGILAAIGAVIYYVFFKSPETVEVQKPAALQANEALAGIQLNTEALVSAPGFQSLQQYIPALAATTTGRANPFTPATGSGLTPSLGAGTSTTGF